MRDIITGIRQKVNELYKKAEEIKALAREHFEGKDVTAKLAHLTESWYQSVMTLFKTHDYSRTEDFASLYEGNHVHTISYPYSPGAIKLTADDFKYYSQHMDMAIALLRSFPKELEMRSMSIYSQLSFEFATDEYEQAEELLKVHVRAAGAVAGVALERHVHTLANTKGVKVESHPSSKTKPDFSDYLNALKKADVINEVLKKQFEALYQVRKSCSHPEEVDPEDVKRLIREGKMLASTIT